MSGADQGLYLWMALVLVAAMIFRFVSRVKGGGWTTAFRASIWILLLDLLYIPKFPPVVYLMLITLIASACFLFRRSHEALRVGFYVSAAFLGMGVTSLVLFLSRIQD